MNQAGQDVSKPRLNTIFFSLALIWVTITLALAGWDYRTAYSSTFEAARSMARESYEKDIDFRLWGTMHGGVYVPITPDTPPNPYLAHIPERDISTPSGRKLTLMNPAYMTRQIYDLEKRKGLGAFGLGHITSLKPIRPENSPDDWERRAFQLFEQGQKEVISLETLGEKSYLRLMRPLITESGCLKCHAVQGYKVGDIRGGVSISLPMAPLYQALQSQFYIIIVIYGFLLVLGLLSLYLGRNWTAKYLSSRNKAEELLKASELRWRLSLDNMLDAYALHEAIFDGSGRMVDYRFIEFNPAAQKISNIAREEIIGRTVLELYPHILERGLMARYAEVMATGMPAVINDFYYTGDNLDKAFDISCFRIDDRHFVCVFRDITERRLAEEALREQTAIAQEFMDALPCVALLLKSRTREIVALNKAARAAGAQLGATCFGSWPKTDIACHFCRAPELWGTGKTQTIEIESIGVYWEAHWVPVSEDLYLHYAFDITERKKAEQVQAFLAQTSVGTEGEAFFEKLAEFIARTLNMDFVCIDRLEGDGLTARTLAVWHDGKFEDNITYALKDTPCGDVVGKTVCCFPAGVCQLFPHDQVLQDLYAESYVGVTLWSHTGQPIGLIAVIGSKALASRKLAETILEMVAVRAAGELERLDAEEARKRLVEETAALANIGRVISSTLDIEEVYERFAAEAKKLIPFDRIAVYLHSLHEGTVTVAYVSGDEIPGRHRGISFPLKNSMSEVLIETRETLLGYPKAAEEMHRKFHDHNIPALDAVVPSLVRVPMIYRNEVIGILHFGSKTPNVYTTEDLRLAERIGAQIAGAIGNAQLFKDLSKTEESLRESEERLQRSEKMEALGQLAGGVAHDLNNVLGIMSGYSELLMEEIPEGNRSRNHVEQILNSTKKGAAIIQDLLTLARRGVTVSKVINLNHIVSDFLQTPVFDKFKEYHPRVTFRTECDKNLLNIKGSPIHLEKTLMNLVSNAAEAISGDGEVTIKTESRYLDKPLQAYDEVQEGDYAVLMVSDTGMGISVEDREKIFEPFYTKKKMGRSGTGLGLAIVWGTVKDHNGYIDVHTEVGGGTTFTLYFPVTREELTSPEAEVPIEQYMGNGESVLVVDDIAEQREIASKLLTRLGYEVHKVSSGEHAVEYLKSTKADILVLDMIMAPGIDGLETYQRVLEINPKQKVIIVSGFSETDRVGEAQKLGAGAYIKKPYVLEKIGVAIRDELKR